MYLNLLILFLILLIYIYVSQNRIIYIKNDKSNLNELDKKLKQNVERSVQESEYENRTSAWLAYEYKYKVRKLEQLYNEISNTPLSSSVRIFLENRILKHELKLCELINEIEFRLSVVPKTIDVIKAIVEYGEEDV